MTDVIEQHKLKLRTYFDGVGFERWAAIYGQSELSRVRRTIRAGHTAMLAQAQTWLTEWAAANGRTNNAQVLDAGCGTGLFSVMLAQQGFTLTSADIAPQMVQAASVAATDADVADRITFLTGDLEAVNGRYDAVVCFDVLVHYPRPLFAQLLTHLANLCDGQLLLTYAPATPLLSALHWIGGRFPRSQRRQDIQMIPERFVRETLEAAGMELRRSTRISSGFYHVTLLEAVRRKDAR